MKSVHAVLNQTPCSAVEKSAPEPVPAVSIKKSVHHDYLVSLETGQRFKSLRRHLSARGMTPDDYRSKWGLAADYPMVAAGYSAHRSELSKSLGLGRKKADQAEAPAVVFDTRSTPVAPVEAEAPATALESFREAAEAQQEAA